MAGWSAAIAARTVDRRPHGGVDVGELGVAVGMVRPLPGLAVGLAAVAELAQQPAHQLLADLEAALAQRSSDLALAAADPAQRRLRIAADRVLDQRLERRRQAWLQHHRPLASPSRPTDPLPDRIGSALQFHDRPPDRAARHAGRQGGRGHAAIADRQGLVRREQPASSLVQERDGPPIPLPDVIHIDHSGRLRQPASAASADLRPCPAVGHQT
jgi:hypothetical protein